VLKVENKRKDTHLSEKIEVVDKSVCGMRAAVVRHHYGVNESKLFYQDQQKPTFHEVQKFLV
jgi:hypothetical protein